LPLTSHVPTTAERIRSACARAGGALLAIEHNQLDEAAHEAQRRGPIATPVHHLLEDGSFAVALPTVDENCGVSGSRAVLELTDYAPLPLREPVRSLVWVRGRLLQIPPTAVSGTLDLIAAGYPSPVLLQIDTPRSMPSDREETRYALLRLEIESVVVTDATGAEPVSAAELMSANADPFCEIESTLLWHLDTVHGDVVDRLASRLPAALRRGRVRPLGLDRYGVRFRAECNDGDHDIRLPFHKPVNDMTGLGQAIRALMGCPFVNGLRARH